MELISDPLDRETAHGMPWRHDFVTNGYAVINGFDTRAVMRRLATAMWELEKVVKEHPEDFPSAVWEPDQPDEIRSIYDIHNLLPPVTQEVFSDGDAGAVAKQFLGSDFAFHQSHFNFKKAMVGGDFGWHSDFTFWHYDDGMREPRALSVIIPINDMTETNGPLLVIPGSHQYWFPRDWSKRPPPGEAIVHEDRGDQDYEYGLVSKQELRALCDTIGTRPRAVTAPSGSIILMHGNLVHASGPNIAPYDRSALFGVLNSVENKLDPVPEDRRRPNYYTDRTGQEIMAAKLAADDCHDCTEVEYENPDS